MATPLIASVGVKINGLLLLFLNWLFRPVVFSLLMVTHASGQDQLLVPDQLVGGEFSYVVQKEDSLTGIGARFGVDVGFLAATNGLSARALLKVGQQLRIDNRHIVPNMIQNGIVINIPQRMLYYFKESRLVRSFPSGTGTA